MKAKLSEGTSAPGLSWSASSSWKRRPCRGWKSKHHRTNMSDPSDVSRTFSSASSPVTSTTSPPPVSSGFLAGASTLRGFWMGFWVAAFLTGSSFPFPFFPFFPLSFSSLAEPADWTRKGLKCYCVRVGMALYSARGGGTLTPSSCSISSLSSSSWSLYFSLIFFNLFYSGRTGKAENGGKKKNPESKNIRQLKKKYGTGAQHLCFGSAANNYLNS